jgi:hypothetical protein
LGDATTNWLHKEYWIRRLGHIADLNSGGSFANARNSSLPSLPEHNSRISRTEKGNVVREEQISHGIVHALQSQFSIQSSPFCSIRLINKNKSDIMENSLIIFDKSGILGNGLIDSGKLANHLMMQTISINSFVNGIVFINALRFMI